MPLTRRTLCTGIAASIGVAARAQTLPDVIKILVVVPPGASMDNIARVVADPRAAANAALLLFGAVGRTTAKGRVRLFDQRSWSAAPCAIADLGASVAAVHH